MNMRQARIRAGQHPDPASAERLARRGQAIVAPTAKSNTRKRAKR